MGKNEIIINQSLKDFILPLNKEEYYLLEMSMINEGCRDPLSVWEDSNGDFILIDGHHRYSICKKHDLRFEIQILKFDNIEGVKSWMIDNQLGRRNLSREQLSYYRGLKYLKLRNKRGGYNAVLKKGDSESTADLLSTEFKVSESTIKRDAKFAQALEIIAKSNTKLRNKILRGAADLNKSDILMLLNAKDPENLKISNEADLYNKAKNIEKSLLDDIESRVRDINEEKLNRAQETLQNTDPVFLEKEDRIRKIKGMIISSMNRAINNHDPLAIQELKELIDQLQQVVFTNH